VLRRVEQVAIAAYEATECCDYARLDIRLQGNRPYVLEVNPNPDLTEGVSFMDSAERAGYTFPQALARIVEFAAERKPKHEPPKPKLEQAAASEMDVRQLSVMLDPAGQAEKAPSLPDIVRPLLHEGPLDPPAEEAGQEC
jgi:hypothetical protein